MINLTDNAQKHMDNYLQQVRDCLKVCSSIDADEVEQNIKEHIESELQGSSEPISYDVLEAVLKKLGSPQQWVPEEEISWWRKIILRLRKGPEDWRLAYISFGLFLLSFLVGKQMPFFAVFLWPIIILRGTSTVVFLFGSFLAARAALAVAPDRNKLGGQKWLLYPPLIVVYAGLVILMIGWPIAPFRLDVYKCPLSETPFLVMGLWLVLLGITFCIWPKLVRAIFSPFADWWKRIYAVTLIVAGAALFLAFLRDYYG